MIITKLMGGLGNQLFQWAYGKHLSTKYNTPLYLDLQFYESQGDTAKRKFSLDKFPNLAYAEKTKEKVKTEKLLDNFEFSELKYAKDSNYFLDGYWQSEKYFKGSEEVIRQELLPSKGVWLNQERGASKIVSMHIRRTDYVALNDYHPVQPISYYQKAIEAIGDYDQIFVFSDDIKWCRTNLKFNNMKFINRLDDIEDLWLMAMCQPIGTKVRTIEGEVNIEDIRKNDVVSSYCMNTQTKKIVGRGSVGQGFPPGRKVTEVVSRDFEGDLVVVTAGGKKTRYTPEHPCIIRMGNCFKDIHLVYLMEKAGNYRVGITSPTKHHYQRKIDVIGTSDPRRRLHCEKADKLWVLGSFDNILDALMEESYISCKFNLPQVRFIDPKEDVQQRYDTFWERVGGNRSGAVECLANYKRSINLPLIDKKDKSRVMVGDKEIVLNACNLMQGMVVLDADVYCEDGGKGESHKSWVPIEVSTEYYNGKVYSLTVDINHTYIADGIVTHNCSHNIIANSSFSWWGAWLNDNPSKKVVTPLRWFGPQAGLSSLEIVPDNWISL